VIGVDTVREANGLAMSSRNGYLSVEQHHQASQLNQALQHIVTQIQNNIQQNHIVNFHQLENEAIALLKTQGWIVDYVSIKSALTLSNASGTDSHLVVLAAAKLGNTRLIDNIEFLRALH
jgi:pantoate--beta-alanine ligase